MCGKLVTVSDLGVAKANPGKGPWLDRERADRTGAVGATCNVCGRCAASQPCLEAEALGPAFCPLAFLHVSGVISSQVFSLLLANFMSCQMSGVAKVYKGHRMFLCSNSRVVTTEVSRNLGFRANVAGTAGIHPPAAGVNPRGGLQRRNIWQSQRLSIGTDRERPT